MKLSPFGSGNSNPLFISKNLKVLESKPLSGGKHLKLKLSNGGTQWITANAWRKGHLSEKVKEDSIVDIVYTLDLNTWSGRSSLVMIVEDIIVK